MFLPVEANTHVENKITITILLIGVDNIFNKITKVVLVC